MDWEIIHILDTLLVIGITFFAGMFAYYSSVIVAEEKKAKRHMNKLPKKREDKPGPMISHDDIRNPDLGKGKFDKQRVVYRDGDNT
tara:strand:- start:24 stop:281 length:258 start_codon:yes stop_codon:yes gene_type:complete